MKLETFFEKFDQFADAPNAVERMRELVLEFAVRGLLSERSENDQAAPAWREFIKEFDHRIYSYDPGPPPPFEIPDEWRWVCLNDLGKTKARNDVADGTRVAFTPMALIPAAYGFSAQSEERTWSEVKKGFTHFADGDVVMAKITPCFENGKSAVMRKLLNGVGAGTTELHVFRRESDVILPEFVLIYLKTRGFIKRGEPRMTGSAGQKRIPHDYFAGSPFPLPPPAEQKRIVAKVDELMRLCDRLEAQQQEREKLLPLLSRATHTRFMAESSEVNLQAIFSLSALVSPDELGNSICSLAVSGRIVPPQSDDHDVSKVLANYDIDAVDPPDAPLLPKHWKWVRLGDATTTMNSGWSPACPPKPANPKEWGVLKTTAVQTLEYLEHENKVLPTNLEPRPEAEVHDGDILLTRAGPSNRVGVICVARPTRPRLMISDKIIRLHLIREILPDFGALALNTGYTSECIAKLKSGMAASQMNISQPKLRSVPIPVPPISEQRLILERVAHLLTLVRQLAEQKRKKSEVLKSFAKAAVAAITSTEFKENEIIKPPKIEVVTALKVGSRPKKSDMAPLTTLLLAQKAEASAKTLWQLSGLEIEVYYRQLKTEIANGWIEEDTTMRDVKEVEVG